MRPPHWANLHMFRGPGLYNRKPLPLSVPAAKATPLHNVVLVDLLTSNVARYAAESFVAYPRASRLPPCAARPAAVRGRSLGPHARRPGLTRARLLSTGVAGFSMRHAAERVACLVEQPPRGALRRRD